jgi:drug/metabolite transporter (DMT)-like permease
MEPWIAITLLGVLVQNSRTVLQKNLVGKLSVGGATYARFLYGAPLAWLMVTTAMIFAGVSTLPQPGVLFLAYVTFGGIAQILGNALFVHLIRASNFAVITTYIKTETVITALFSFILLGDRLSLLGAGGIFITFFGVVVLASGQAPGILHPIRTFAWRHMLCGLGVGALYAIGSTGYRGAILSLEGDVVVASLFTLACVSLWQAVLMSVWLQIKQPEVLRQTVRCWRSAVWIGITGATASAAFYLAFSQQFSAYVLALGQVELILTYLYSRFMFKERAGSRAVLGIVITVVGILAVVLAI